MSVTLLKTALRDQMRRPWLALLMILSVALGVAVVVSVDLANQSASRAFQLSTDAVVGKATHQIVGGTNGFDQSVYTRLRVDRCTGERLIGEFSWSLKSHEKVPSGFARRNLQHP